MPGYKHQCIYCGKLIENDAKYCPYCAKVNPLGPLRCPRCRNPITKEYKVCANCGLNLIIICPKCKKETFFGDYCDNCNERLLVVCKNPKCKEEQPPVQSNCIKCGKPL